MCGISMRVFACIQLCVLAWECMLSYEDVCFFGNFVYFKVVARPAGGENELRVRVKCVRGVGECFCMSGIVCACMGVYDII